MTVLVTPLASGSDGNAMLLRCGATAILLDCGLSLRRLEPLLCYAGVHPSTLQAILLTHEHDDHALGAGILARRYGVPVVCNGATRAALGHKLKQVPVEELPMNKRASIGAFDICSFGVPHDAADPVGYCITAEEVTVGVAVDLGSWTDTIATRLRAADLLIVEANHSRAQLLASAYPWQVCQRIAGPRGHLDNRQAGELLANIGADRRQRDVRLAHLSAQANKPRQAINMIKTRLDNAGITTMRLGVLPRQATPTRRGMPVWSSDGLFRQMELFH